VGFEVGFVAMIMRMVIMRMRMRMMN